MFKVPKAKLLSVAIVLMLGAATVSFAGQDLMAKESSSVSPEKYRMLSAWAEAIRDRIRRRIVGDTRGLEDNPEVVYVVDLAQTGQVIGIRLQKSSENPKWDAAVLRGIASSSPLPAMSDGTVEDRLILAFRPFVSPKWAPYQPVPNN